MTRPTGENASEIASYRKEFLDACEVIDGAGPLAKIEDPEEYIRFCAESENLPPPATTSTRFFLVRKSDGRILGLIQIRYRLNEYLEKVGGHIGYSVRPSERRKGYAKMMLSMALPLCREAGYDHVMISCATTNIASEKTIRANGGVYESTVWDSKTNTNYKRFLITLSCDSEKKQTKF